MEHEDLLEKVVSAPALALEKTVEGTKDITNKVTSHAHMKKARDFWHNLGPGLTTGAADDDPSGIATYSQTGSQYGFQLLWLAGFTFPLMAIVQEMCARIGMVTGRGLAANIRQYYPKWVLYICTALLFMANSFNIGADLMAMAKATELVTSFQYKELILFFALFSLALQIFTTYDKFAKYLKWLALILLSYIFSALLVDLDFNTLLKNTVFPSITFSKEQILLITAILGTTISPYLFFWQTSQEIEEQILEGKTSIKQRTASEVSAKEIKNMRVDVWSGMFLSNIVMYFIIAACAATLYGAGGTTITTAADAASALKPLAGDAAYLLFALGIIGTGMLAVPVLAGSASYALSESFGWKFGLYRKLKEANAFYGVIIISTLIGLGIGFTGIDPMKILIYSAVANGLIAPVVLVLIVLLSSNKKVMGERVNHPVTTVIGWMVTVAMIIAGLATLYSLFA